MQMLFSFTEELIEPDGDKIIVDVTKDKIKVISEMLACSKAKAIETLKLLEEEYQVYVKNNQVILCKDRSVVYNFETYGATWFGGHKYNEVNEWDFRAFVEGKKIRTEKKAPKIKKIVITCTETQIKRAKQLFYAKSIGFNVGYADYKRFYLI